METMQEVIMGEDSFLRIKIDFNTIKKLQLEIELETIKEAIERAPKLKLSDSVKIETNYSLRVAIPRSKTESNNTYIALQNLKRLLPNVVVKGLPSTSRAVINDVTADGRLELMIEGYGLKEVMGTEGVEGLKCKSNHILEMLSTLGIEAARETIVREILETMRSHG
jgi:DNA-directed RNA polymerase III subunit RPC1